MDKPESPNIEPVRFVADARLLSILGEQLIGSEKVGVLELIKNAYDANASSCAVTIDGVPGMPPKTRSLARYQDLPGPVIEVRDNGIGMSREDIVNGWLRPATRHRGQIKERLKREQEIAERRGTMEAYQVLVEALKREHGGRIPLGEKGVGRLATHRLGRHLWLRTKTAGETREWELRIDWDDFEKIGPTPVDLGAIDLTLVNQNPTFDYGPRGSGTVLVCYGGRQGYAWTKEALIDLSRAIATLQSPRAGAGFVVEFRTPHVPEESLGTQPILGAPFEMLALVDASGMADIELHFKPPEHLDGGPPPFEIKDRIDLRKKNLDYWQRTSQGQPEADAVAHGSATRSSTSGPFIISVRCWIRLPKWLGPDYRELASYLDHFGGLAIYRDGILAQPTQQAAKSDWLGLAGRQIKKASKLSYYQIIGEIEIEQSKTLALRDKSSREGMIETQPFNDLTELTKAVLAELEFQTRKVRDAWSRRQRRREASGASVALATKAAVRTLEALAKSYDFKKDDLGLRLPGGVASAERATAMSQVLRDLPEQISLRAEERDGLLEAAGFGLAVAVGIHEIANVASAIVADCRALLREFASGERASAQLRHVTERAESLVAEVRRLAPLRTSRVQPTGRVSLRRAVEVARNAFGSSLSGGAISVHIDGDDFDVSGRFGAITQVFANLFDNALYWLQTTDRDRTIRVILDSQARTVLFADSGPGISEKMRPVLFEPFFSEKSNPSGLGLYICRHYLSPMKATIRLAASRERCDLAGAQFLLLFPERSA